MSEEINYDRRHFLGTALTSIAAAELGLVASSNGQSSDVKSSDVKSSANKSFAPFEADRRGPIECWIRRIRPE
jgi:hypothetical protein